MYLKGPGSNLMVDMRNFLFFLFHHQKFEDMACGLFELGVMSSNF